MEEGMVRVVKLRNRHGSGYMKIALYEEQDPYTIISCLMEAGMLIDNNVEWHVIDHVIYITRNMNAN